MFNIKSDHGLSEDGYDKIIEWARSILLKENRLKKNFYAAKSMIKTFSLGYRELTCLFNRLVDPYRVISSNDLEENSNFHIIKNIFVDVDVDVEELNDVLCSNGHTQKNEIAIKMRTSQWMKKKKILMNLYNTNV